MSVDPNPETRRTSQVETKPLPDAVSVPFLTSEVSDNLLEQWKEINGYARHWETLTFETAKNSFTLIAAAVGGAGAVAAWTGIALPLQKLTVYVLLALSVWLSAAAFFMLGSQRRFLNRIYARRNAFEAEGLILRDPNRGSSGTTMPILQWSFPVAAIGAATLITLLYRSPESPALKDANLSGADLRAVKGLNQADLEGACGNAETQLPIGLDLPPCRGPRE